MLDQGSRSRTAVAASGCDAVSDDSRGPRSEISLRKCGVKTISIPWAEKHGRFTLLFEAFAINVLLAAANVQAAATLLKVDWSTAQSIMERAVARGLERRSLDKVKHVGIDEKSFGKGCLDALGRQGLHVSIMTDLDGSRVLEVAPERTLEACDALWKTLSQSQKSEIQAVCMDMWQAY